MQINNSFEVPLPPADAWKVLMDIPRIAPCMPGAELTGVVDKDTYSGKVSVRLGPVALTFAGQVTFSDIDEFSHKARVKAQGKDAKGRGGAHANVDFHLEPLPLGSRVVLKTDLTLSGAIAQYGRASGMIQDVAQQLIGQFADCLKDQIASSRGEAESSPTVAVAVENTIRPPKQKALSGFSLLFIALSGVFRRLFAGKP